ncbi:MarR family transcriptional regulator [Streptomyces inhibens]|uniref:MarR family transcriptional regulator n=1 Tax=Streptomyces inhibens TaxID=2293571 RepID=A0A371Q743_STRIH|nr:MarR family winged helix-turn-helix transcriptional regulator [Streptomyces inhibens]REK90481.1 MarR family transcriptional regulator [Streptomyces inhibens]
MSNGTLHACDGAAPQVTASSKLDEAAAGLGAEIVRFSRLIAAWKQRAKTDGGAADRVLLARLVVGGDRRATDLAADAFLDLSTVSRQVRSLVERGLVARRPDPEDRRGVLLAATDAGRAAFENYRRQRDAELAGLLASWSPQDRADLIRLMGRLNEDMAERQHTRLGPGGDQGASVEQGETRT